MVGYLTSFYMGTRVSPETSSALSSFLLGLVGNLVARFTGIPNVVILLNGAHSGRFKFKLA